MAFTSKKIEVIRINSIDVPTGIYDTIECPADKADKFSEDMWIMHPGRNEPCRLYSTGRNPEAKYLN